MARLTSVTPIGTSRSWPYSGWIWAITALAMVQPTSMQGIRAKVTDRVPWTMLGLGAGGIWLAVMFISVFTPVIVTGTAPWITDVPLASMLSVIARDLRDLATLQDGEDGLLPVGAAAAGARDDHADGRP